MTLKHLVRQHEPFLIMDDSVMVCNVIERMVDEGVGAALILSSEQKLSGIFTERDVLTKIVLQGLDPAGTPVTDVMTTDIITIEEEQSLDAAIHCIQSYQLSHLPIVNEGGHVVGILTIRRLLHDKVKDLLDGLQNFEAYFNDSSGG